MKILSVNTWKCEGKYPERIHLMSENLKELDLEILVCQEVFETADESISTRKIFSDALNAESYYLPSRSKTRKLNGNDYLSFSGLSIFTNIKVLQESHLQLPSCRDDHDRTAQLLIIKEKDKKIAIVNTHLTHLKNANEIKFKQIHSIIEEVKRYQNLDAIIICGDFNSIPQSDVIDSLIQEPNKFKNVFDLDLPTNYSGKRIDYIFYSSKKISVVQKKILLDKPVKGIQLSDHFGLFVQFKF